jgi:hypothetical protein
MYWRAAWTPHEAEKSIHADLLGDQGGLDEGGGLEANMDGIYVRQLLGYVHWTFQFEFRMQSSATQPAIRCSTTAGVCPV